MSDNNIIEKNDMQEEVINHRPDEILNDNPYTEETADRTVEDLEAENEKLRRELELMKEKTVKERIYDHVHVSVRTMDIFIGVMVALFVIVVVLGLINK